MAPPVIISDVEISQANPIITIDLDTGTVV